MKTARKNARLKHVRIYHNAPHINGGSFDLYVGKHPIVMCCGSRERAEQYASIAEKAIAAFLKG